MSPQRELFPRGLLFEICPLLVSGLTDHQIAAELDVDDLAVLEYITWILATLRLASRSELVSLLRDHFGTAAA